MDLFQIYTDLLNFEPVNINLPDVSGEDIEDIQQRFQHLYHQLQRATRLKNHHQALYLAYYLGKLIERDVLSRCQKRLLKSLLTTYYAQGVEKTFLLFDFYGVEQIFRTKRLTLRIIHNIKATELRQLLSPNFAGAQN